MTMMLARTVLPALLAATAAAGLAVAQPASPLDGQWRGQSDGGSCNAPLDYVLTIETGIVDGSATDTTAHGPTPNTKKGPPPAPMAGLWQIHGLARPSGQFTLISVASVRGTNRLEGKLNASLEGNTLVVSETSGCRRTARLTRSR
jgi:hypothetical protein